MNELIKRIKKTLHHFEQFYASCIRNIDGAFGNFLRKKFYRRRLKFLGEDVIIDTGAYFYNMHRISIGKGTHIDKGCILIASPDDLDLSNRIIVRKINQNIIIESGELIIGKNCHISQNSMIFAYAGVKIGDNCVLSTGSKLYSLSSLPVDPSSPDKKISIMPYNHESPTVLGPIELEYNCWLGINVIVLPGVRIQRDSFVRTNSIVQSSFQENSYLAGDPARYIRPRFGQKNETSF